MKILYLSCHSILEYDELKLLEEMGHEYFSLGSYIDPQRPVDPIRPALNTKVREHLLHQAPERSKLPKEFVDQFDVVIVMHVPEWITENWGVLKGKNVIWRTIGQSTQAIEKKLFQCRQEGLKVVRYSPREINIVDNIGCDAVIRFYKDPMEFGQWNGLSKQVITFAQNMRHRGEFCNWELYTKVVQNLPAKLYGPNNENADNLNGGFLTYEEMKQKYKDGSVYFYTGTQPASYTLNFIESLMTGIPVVAIGPKYGNSLNIAGDLYEIPDLIHNGVNGYWSDSVEELQGYITKLLENPLLAKKIGDAGRITALELFGKDRIKAQWNAFLNSL